LLLGDSAASVPLLRKAAELNPDDPSSFYLLSKALKAEGRAQDAADALRRVAALHVSAVAMERRTLNDAGIVKDAGVERTQ
jgi:cytochrome c-type biogenesis protein CcmH/NrfG